jgi:hypothetical protein
MIMETKPLTKAEKAWLNKIEKLLMNPPTNRIGFYTIGDNDLLTYDRTRENEIAKAMDDSFKCIDWGTTVNDLNAGFEPVYSACVIHSTAG